VGHVATLKCDMTQSQSPEGKRLHGNRLAMPRKFVMLSPDRCHAELSLARRNHSQINILRSDGAGDLGDHAQAVEGNPFTKEYLCQRDWSTRAATVTWCQGPCGQFAPEVTGGVRSNPNEYSKSASEAGL
jgi:hypothetical protein